MNRPNWPELDYASFKPTGDALHLWLQIVGKYRLATTPWINHSWHATFYVTPHGFSTGNLPLGTATLEFQFDLRRHVLRGISSEAVPEAEMPLQAESVAEFHRRFIELTHALGYPLHFHSSPNEVANPIPFRDDLQPRPYDRGAGEAFHGAMRQADRVFRQFRTEYLGKVSPVHLFWGSFDLAVTRFSGRRAPLHPGGIPSLPDAVTREAYSHEVSSAGFWAGGNGVEEAAFYAYAYPAPEGFGVAKIEPAGARFDSTLGEFILPYRAVREAADPDQTLLAFLRTTWRAAADLGHWPLAGLECAPGQPGVPRAVQAPESHP